MSLFTVKTVEEAKELIALGHDVNAKRVFGFPILHRACKKGKLDIVKVLCEAGANVNEEFFKRYPIDWAAGAGYLDIVKYLIENHPVNLDNVLTVAAISGHTDVFDYLLTLNLDLNSHPENPLTWACYYHHIDIVDRLLYAGADTNIVDRFGDTSMTIATLRNKLDLIKKLVMFGANYHTYGGKSLVISCKKEFDEISEFLIDLGCSPNYCFNNMTPLIHACNNNNLKIVKLLLERGADPNFISDDGKKAIDYCRSDEVRALFIKN